MPESLPADSAETLSERELRSLIARHLPAWLQACDDADGDSIVLHEASFGTSTHELFLFACAIKYAAAKGKNVHVAAGTGGSKHKPETLLPSASLGSVYHENTPVKRHRPFRRSSNQMKRKK